MLFKSRKLTIGFVALLAVLVVFILVTQLDRTPKIEYDSPADSLEDIGGVGNKVGKIGRTTGVGTIEKAVFYEINEQKQVVAEFGFEKLLHKAAERWEIQKPYRNIFRSSFKCYITADKGTVLLETGVDKPTPKDATFTGNVVIHIVPEEKSSARESFVYLDDIVFINERSLFTTTGSVRFVSADVSLTGRGLELVYNEEQERVEYLGIIDLHSLRIKTSKKAMFSRTDKPPKEASTTAKSQPPAATVVGRSVSETTNQASADDDSQQAKHTLTSQKQSPDKKEGNSYRCVFSKNVIIDAPGQLVFADDKILIDNIFLAKSSQETSGRAAVRGDSNYKAPVVGNNAPYPRDRQKPSRTKPGRAEPNQAGEQKIDVVVTCDGGIVVTPVDSTRAYIKSMKLKDNDSSTDKEKSKTPPDAEGRPTFSAPRIDYDASNDRTLATGASVLTFFAKDVVGAEAGKKPVPVKVNAAKKVLFLPASNKVLFEGDCLCTMLRSQKNIEQKYMLSAPRFTINLSRDKSADADIEHFTADDGIVRLTTVKTTDGRFVGGVELKCHRFDFDPNRQVALVTGPGVIKMDNSRITAPEKPAGKFSLRKPCWAVAKDFDTLKYFTEDNKIFIDAKTGRINVGYLSILDGRIANATAGHIEAELAETGTGRNELSSLWAKNGVSYEEKTEDNGKSKRDKGIQFMGSNFFYDGEKQFITAWGNKTWPCFLNGARAKGIEYNLKTGKAKTKLVGPGVLY